MTSPRHHQTIVTVRFPALLFAVAGLSWTASGIATANEGFTEPYRQIHVAAPESGIIGQVLVEQGVPVKQQQPLVQLDVEVHEALLAVAKAGKEARGRVDAAQAEVAVREQRLAALQALSATGHARQEELDRATADVAIAQGQLTAAHEAQRLKDLEYRRIQVQIDRRTVRSPIDGVVTEILKREGEFTAPNDPNLVVVVQLDPLVATFDVTSQVAKNLAVGKEIRVKFLESNEIVNAAVDNISPVIEAESGTIAIKVRINNPNGSLQSGEACLLDVGDGFATSP